ncbi:hypothetical protein O181_052816 [Austropuccinia psidii MF-1]|uniref:Uncharacterized protein n=1 Tax=Austropuccinia psidii MF-1 TaxID=1389203 RepID=A0A9Q3HPL7_9BASI|nr:hypothetical protein [Austropuccinia psidii MF-1]
MVRRFCAYVLEFKYFDGFTHYWCTLLPALELAYETCIKANTNMTPAVLEKGWNPRLPQYSLSKGLVELHPTEASFKGMLEKARKHAIRFWRTHLHMPKTSGTNHMQPQTSKWDI